MSASRDVRDRKSEIEVVALDLAYEAGPDLVTTGMIASRLNISQPAIYKHFPSKADIWMSVARQMSAKIAENLKVAKASSDDPAQRIRLLIIGHLKLVQEYPALPDIMVARDIEGELQACRQHLQAAMADFRSVLTLEVRSAVCKGLFKPALRAEDVAALLFGIVQSLVMKMLVNRNPSVLLDDGERLLRLQLEGFWNTGEQE